MLTICTRCRTPYDHRQTLPTGPLVLAGACDACVTGAARAEVPMLATVAHLDVELTVLPRTVLPVAS
ncbi:MAG: hypothetical protein AB7O74_14025 [Candidatus Nanopelagicales bacterium]